MDKQSRHNLSRHRLQNAGMQGTVSTKELIGQPVYDINGEVFGRLDEIVLEAERGMAAYVVIEPEGNGECILPFVMVSVETDPPRMQAAVSRDVFQS